MRPLAFILLLASCGALHGQDQERKLVDRILKPDMTLASPLQSKTYYGGSGGNGVDTSKYANVKDFYFIQKFSSKAFDTKQFAAKDFSKGDGQFATKPAAFKTDAVPEKTYGTKTVPIKGASEAGKGYAADVKTYATRDSPEKGKTSQNHLDETYKGKTQMNIDQVRDLLNKPPL